VLKVIKNIFNLFTNFVSLERWYNTLHILPTEECKDFASLKIILILVLLSLLLQKLYFLQ